MKVKYIGKADDLDLTEGKVYEVLSVEKRWYRVVVDEPLSDDYLFPPELFEVVEE